MASWSATTRWWMKAATNSPTFNIPACRRMTFSKRCIASTTNIIFDPKAVFRILRKAAFNSVDRKRLYKEAKTFLKVRAMRHKWVKDKRERTIPPPQSHRQRRSGLLNNLIRIGQITFRRDGNLIRIRASLQRCRNLLTESIAPLGAEVTATKVPCCHPEQNSCHPERSERSMYSLFASRALET